MSQADTIYMWPLKPHHRPRVQALSAHSANVSRLILKYPPLQAHIKNTFLIQTIFTMIFTPDITSKQVNVPFSSQRSEYLSIALINPQSMPCQSSANWYSWQSSQWHHNPPIFVPAHSETSSSTTATHTTLLSWFERPAFSHLILPFSSQ